MACQNYGTWDSPMWLEVGTGAYCGYMGDSPTPPQQSVKVIATPTTGINVSQGQTTLDKILASVLSGLALVKQAPYVPTTAHPLSQSAVTPQQDISSLQQQLLLQQQLQSSAGGKFGDSVQKFITENTGLLLAAGLALVLFKSGRK